jgi:hypothetical protein
MVSSPEWFRKFRCGIDTKDSARSLVGHVGARAAKIDGKGELPTMATKKAAKKAVKKAVKKAPAKKAAKKKK